ncbi:substrate-binding periplasmic protein [Aliagarivorans marinus]|uniref:substrate-binding periplasmic protein n=1 Tax=Aliagarivorans marinus TaxID=561965 RepID=UPI00040657B6|nr:transporter substrate-binding domain-containing protein [Aliagarivorans marinus]
MLSWIQKRRVCLITSGPSVTRYVSSITQLLLCTALLAQPSISHAKDSILLASGELAPFSYSNHGRSGVVNELVVEGFQAAGISAHFHFMPWPRAIRHTRAGLYLASSYWYYHSDREADFYFSAPLLTDIEVFVVRNERFPAPLNSLEDLAGSNIGITRAYTYTQELFDKEQQKFFRLEVANNDEQNFAKLAAGRIDAFPVSLYLANLYLKSLHPVQAANLRISKLRLGERTCYVLFSKRHPLAPKFLAAFNQGLEQIKQNSRYQQILDKYRDSYIPET